MFGTTRVCESSYSKGMADGAHLVRNVCRSGLPDTQMEVRRQGGRLGLFNIAPGMGSDSVAWV